MKILLLSDSHQSSIAFDFSKYDFIIHCGDYGTSLDTLKENQILYVRGNCDTIGPEALELKFASKKIFVTHGHLENVKFTLNRLLYKALEKNCQVCMFGHTHQQVCFIEEDILFLNPGSYPESYIEIDDETITLHQRNSIKNISYRW